MRVRIAGGKYTKINISDYAKLKRSGPWHVSEKGYAIKRQYVGGERKVVYLHRIINETPDFLQTDHRNGDRLDNRRKNLRTVTNTTNAYNRHVDPKRYRCVGLPKHVTYDFERNKYVGTKVIRKRFDTLKEAIRFSKEK